MAGPRHDGGQRPDHPVRVLASVTSLSPLNLGDDARRLVEAGVDALHVDIGDGHFVPSLFFGPAVVRALVETLGVEVEVHLMVEAPEAWIPQIAACHVRRISFHVEATRYPWRVASMTRGLGVQVGVAVNPVTPIAVLERLAQSVDAVILLATDHDCAGDRLLAGTAQRVRAVRSLVGAAKGLGVDGGVDVSNVVDLVRAGADELVIGRAICRQADWPAAVSSLRQAILGARPMPERLAGEGKGTR